jgi:hypothetical protein
MFLNAATNREKDRRQVMSTIACAVAPSAWGGENTDPWQVLGMGGSVWKGPDPAF